MVTSANCLRILPLLVLLGAAPVLGQDPPVYMDGQGREVTFPQGAASFADTATEYQVGEPAPSRADARDPAQAVGSPNGASLSLGCGGSVVLGFTDNALINVKGPDLYVFEIGPDVESTLVEISVDGGTWIELGPVEGSTAAIDIFYYSPAGAFFRFVRLTDLKASCNAGSFPGADIDAVGAIGSAVEPAAPRCAPPRELSGYVSMLRKRWEKATIRNEGLPDAPLYRRGEVSESDAIAFTSWMYPLVDEVIRNGGPDDWLLGAGGADGLIPAMVSEIETMLAGDETCSTIAWRDLARRLRALKRPFDDRLFRVRAALANAETISLARGTTIRDALATTRADNDFWVKLLRYLGASESDALILPNEITGLSSVATYILWKYNPVLGPISAVFSTAKVFNAGLDLGQIWDARRMVPEFLEMSESKALLQPLVDSYAELDLPLRAIIDITGTYYP